MEQVDTWKTSRQAKLNAKIMLMKHSESTAHSAPLSIWDRSDKEEEESWNMDWKSTLKKEDPFSSYDLEKWNLAKSTEQDQHQTPSCLVARPEFDGSQLTKPNGSQLFQWEFKGESKISCMGWGRNSWKEKRISSLSSNLPEQSSS